MSELGDDFRAMREESKVRRGYNRAESASILRYYNVAFATNNDGAHLVVCHGDKTVDFWPGTGKYIFRGSGKAHRGVFNLLRDLGVTG